MHKYPENSDRGLCLCQSLVEQKGIFLGWGPANESNLLRLYAHQNLRNYIVGSEVRQYTSSLGQLAYQDTATWDQILCRVRPNGGGIPNALDKKHDQWYYTGKNTYTAVVLLKLSFTQKSKTTMLKIDEKTLYK
jgi:hypothetical protein